MFVMAVCLAAATTLPQEALSVAELRAETEKLSRIETVWNQAHVTGDTAVLGGLWADNAVIVVPEKPPMTKWEVLDAMRSRRVRFEKYATSDTQIHFYGDTAVVAGRLQRSRVVDSHLLDEDWQFTKVYIRRADRWQVVAYHASNHVK